MIIEFEDNRKDKRINLTLEAKSIQLDKELSIKLMNNLEIVGRVHKEEDKALLSFNLTGKGSYPCSRCLEDVIIDFDYPFEEEIEIEDNKIDLETYINDCLYINEPTQILCKEDCKGLCPKCGANLNEGECSCQDEPEVDPRLQGLAELLSNSKED